MRGETQWFVVPADKESNKIIADYLTEIGEYNLSKDARDKKDQKYPIYRVPYSVVAYLTKSQKSLVGLRFSVFDRSRQS